MSHVITTWCQRKHQVRAAPSEGTEFAEVRTDNTLHLRWKTESDG